MSTLRFPVNPSLSYTILRIAEYPLSSSPWDDISTFVLLYEFAVKEQAGNEEARREGRNDQPYVGMRVPVQQSIGHPTQSENEKPNKNLPVVEPFVVKGKDKGKEIKAERQHPKERDGRYVLRQVVGHGKQERRGAPREQEPEDLFPHFWRRAIRGRGF